MHLLAVGDGLGILDLEDDSGLFTAAAAAGTGDLQGGAGGAADEGTEAGATLTGGGGLSLDRGGFVGCIFGASSVATTLFMTVSSTSVTSPRPPRPASQVVSRNEGRKGESDVPFIVAFWSSAAAAVAATDDGPSAFGFGSLAKNTVVKIIMLPTM